MVATLEQFKRAFATTVPDESVTRLDKQAVTALNALTKSVAAIRDDDLAQRYKIDLVELGHRYYGAKKQTNRSKSEIAGILEGICHAVIAKLSELKTASTTTSSPDSAPAAPPAGAEPSGTGNSGCGTVGTPTLVVDEFAFDKAQIPSKHLGSLEELRASLIADPDATILLIGHTDTVGKEQYNLKLGESRTAAVRDFFSSKGIDASRIKIESRGEKQPAAGEPPAKSDPDPGQQNPKNRRVEVFVSCSAKASGTDSGPGGGTVNPPDPSVTGVSRGPLPVVTGVSPNKTPAEGGTKVTITGTGFTGAKAVVFENVPAKFVVKSDTQIIATTPDSRGHWTPGSDLRAIVTNANGSNSGRTDPSVRFGEPLTPKSDPTVTGVSRGPLPVVTGVSPNKTPAEGGTKVTITGTGFTGAKAVVFENVPAKFVVKSDTQIIATTPDSRGHWTPGSDLRAIVTNANGSNSGRTDPSVRFGEPLTPKSDPTVTGVSRGPLPVVTGVSPNKTPAEGGTKVTITGTGFTGAKAVVFENVPAKFVVKSDTQIIATTPDSRGHWTPGSDLRAIVTNAAGSNSGRTDPSVRFGDPPPTQTTTSQRPLPKPTAVSPQKSPAKGGIKVTITGTGFTGASKVEFGSPSGPILSARFKVNSDTQITATTPNSSYDYTSSSDLLVIVTTPAGSNRADASAPHVTFGDPPPILPAKEPVNRPASGPLPKPTAVSPQKSPAKGGIKVTITGTGFTGATKVEFGSPSGPDLSARFKVNSDTQITATTPNSSYDYTSSSDLLVIVTTPAGSNRADASAPHVTFGDPPATK